MSVMGVTERRTEPDEEDIAYAAQVFEADVALHRNRHISEAGEDAAWDRAFEFALDMGHSAKSAAHYARSTQTPSRPRRTARRFRPRPRSASGPTPSSSSPARTSPWSTARTQAQSPWPGCASSR